MSVFVVPSLDEDPWPSLGPAIRDLIAERACFGPGDLRGQPTVIDAEKAALIDRMYQVYPRDHPRAGRRRFKRCAVSLRKGSAKTELAAWVSFAELHPEGPVRTDGWRKEAGVWVPVGRPVVDPYIPMLAYTERQTEELAYAALLCMCQEGPDADLFDATYTRITRAYGDGKAVALATAPDSADGARTTFQHFDEGHRLVTDRQKETRQTMRNNLAKRVLADPWELETSTTFAEGENSVAQDTHEYAELVAKGKAKDPSLFFFHREATPKAGEDLNDPVQLRSAIREASGPALARWVDFDGQVDFIAGLYHQPDTDRAYWEQVWLNRRVSATRLAFDVERWKQLARPLFPTDGEPVTVGFDGARWRDGCGFVATHIETGYQWVLELWEKPAGDESWEVTDEQVDALVTDAFTRYHVALLYADPPRFEANVARWAGRHGDRRVLEWYTNRPAQIGRAMRAFKTAQTSGALTHNGDRDYTRHIGNARRHDLRLPDDDGTPLWTVEKERSDSPRLIDLSMAGCLSWQARLDALTKGGWQKPPRRKVIVMS